MNIELYAFGALALVIVVLYFWQRVTATKLKAAEGALAAAEALGKHQEKTTKEADDRSGRIKVNIDAKLKKTISDIDAAYDSLRNSSSGNMSRPDEIRARGIEDSDILRHRLYIALAQKYERLSAEMDAVREWYRRETGG